jgi:YHS domain-containing protein
MMNKAKIIILMALITGLSVTLLLTGCEKKVPVQPSSSTDIPQEVKESTTAEVLEQTTCPVMEGKINKDLFTEYKGKKVYFCCPGCEAEFNKDPEKYIKKLPQFQEK